MGGLGVLAGILSACAFVFLAPAALPERELLRNTKSAFMTALSLACAFLLTDAVYMISHALWGSFASVIICVFFSFVLSKTAEQIILSERKSLNLAAACAVLVLSQPEAESAAEKVLFAVGVAVGIIILLTALSSVLRRISHSDAPRALKGLPSLLLVLGLCALAFGGF